MAGILVSMDDSLVETIGRFRVRELPKAASVAVVDWTTIDHSWLLLTEEHHRNSGFDPFVALADLASLVGALILYDRVVVFDGNDPSSRTRMLATLLSAEDAFNMIEPNERKVGGWSRTGHHSYPSLPETVLQPIWTWAWRQFEASNTPPEPLWASLLKKNWNSLLPGLDFPRHAPLYKVEHFQYSDYTSQTRTTMEGFEFKPTSATWWTTPGNLGRLIVQNDVRSLFYEAWAKELQSALIQWTERSDITVRYIGGCLRAPLQLARSDASLGLTSGVEAMLQNQWRSLAANTYPIRLPFWMDAVLARSKTTDDLIRNISELRTEAHRFRRRRGELEEKLRFGDESVIGQAAASLQGEAAKVSASADLAATSAISAAEAGIRLVAGPLTPFAGVTDAMIEQGRGPINRMLLRITKPDIWLVYRVANQARHARRSLEKAIEVFHLPENLAYRESADFMERLGAVSWIA